MQPPTAGHLEAGHELRALLIAGMGDLTCDLPLPTIAAPLCQDWFVPQLGLIGNYALDVMSFCEQGSLSDDLDMDPDSDIASDQTSGRGGKPLSKRKDGDGEADEAPEHDRPDAERSDVSTRVRKKKQSGTKKKIKSG